MKRNLERTFWRARLKNFWANLFNPQWQGTLSDYVTAVAWSPSGQLAASSAAGEVVLWTQATLTPLQAVTEQSIDCLAFSRN
jgi:WD40 repeat protein